jgi:hypothetical protein
MQQQSGMPPSCHIGDKDRNTPKWRNKRMEGFGSYGIRDSSLELALHVTDRRREAVSRYS